MSTHDDRFDGTDLPELDRTARAAATGLRTHVAAHLDAEAPLGFLSNRGPRRRGRVLAAAAALLLVVGAVAVLDQGEKDQVEVEVDGDSDADPALPPGTLTPLGPRDGKDSIGLPLTAEPSTGLVDGQEITVSGEGFVPGEGVGLVQCALLAAGDAPENRGGVDGCYIDNYTNITADDAGVATGTYKVHRLLTTPLTGTIDCATETDRCMVAMGALSDYDRSGTAPITFDPNVEPVHLPTITVTPTDGLTDGAVVHVVAEGLTPGDRLYAEICSVDPAGCAPVGLPERDSGEPDDGESVTTQADGATVTEIDMRGMEVDADGRAEGDLTVWQYLPGSEPGTYVDCAVSRCSLRLSGQTAPPTVPIAFVPGEGPPAPSAVMEPADGLAVGDEVVVRVGGFRPGTGIMLTMCAHRGEAVEESYVGCSYGQGPEAVTGDDGGVTIDYVIPEIYDETAMMVCSSEEECRDAPPPPVVACGVDGIQCDLRIDAFIPGGGPTFVPAPIPVTFR